MNSVAEFATSFNESARRTISPSANNEVQALVSIVLGRDHPCSLLAYGQCKQCRSYLSTRYGGFVIIDESSFMFEYMKELRASQSVARAICAANGIQSPTVPRPNVGNILHKADFNVSSLDEKTRSLMTEGTPIPEALLSVPCQKAHLDTHHCPPCTEPHLSAHKCAPCKKDHLDGHSCPPCEQEHLNEHRCPPCERPHRDDRRCTPCKSKNLDSVMCPPCLEKRIRNHRCPVCTREHLDEHECEVNECQEEHLDQHTCEPCRLEHVRDNPTPTPRVQRFFRPETGIESPTPSYIESVAVTSSTTIRQSPGLTSPESYHGTAGLMEDDAGPLTDPTMPRASPTLRRETRPTYRTVESMPTPTLPPSPTQSTISSHSRRSIERSITEDQRPSRRERTSDLRQAANREERDRKPRPPVSTLGRIFGSHQPQPSRPREPSRKPTSERRSDGKRD